MIEVVRPGPLTTVQDLGRPGFAHLGVPHCGALDPAGLRLANRLVGNADDAAGLEMTTGGLAVRFHRPAWFALAGAPAPARLADRPVAMGTPCYARPGQLLRIGVPAQGIRTYLAVRGGVDVEPVLGSRSSDLNSGLGPPAVRAGDSLPVGVTAGCADIVVDQAATPELTDRPVLRILPGPRDDWFTDDALATLLSTPYAVSPDSDRTGVRLVGAALSWRGDRELESEGMVTGAIQVPPSGQPILFLADHPPTGGYPVIAVVVTPDIPLAAQLRPGTSVRFRAARPPAAGG